MAKGDRANKITEEVYMEGFYTIRQTSRDGIWEVIDGSVHLNREFPSLNSARAWCKDHPGNPDYEGDHAQ